MTIKELIPVKQKMAIDVAMKLMTIVVNSKSKSRKWFLQGRDVIEENVKIELAVAPSDGDSKMIRASCQSLTMLKILRAS